MNAHSNQFMKTICLRFFLFTGSMFAAFGYLSAQGSNQSILSIGTRHGVNLSQIIFEPPVKQNVYTGYNGGLVIKYVSETHAGIQAEFSYSERGWSENLDSTRNYTRRLTYLESPIMSHFIIGKKKSKVIINVGPNLSYFQGDKENFSLLETGDTLSYYQRPIDRKFELGLVGGIGFLQETGIGDFQLEGRFHYGLQNIFFVNNQSIIDKSQNQFYSISLTYFFFKKDFRAKKKEKTAEQ